MGLLNLGFIIAYADRVNLSVALPEITTDFQLSPAVSGLILSTFFWSYAALQIPAGWFVDRYGVRVPYLAGFLLWSLASIGTACTASVAGIIASRILLGVGQSVVVPASMRYIRVHFVEEKRGLVVGLFLTGAKIGPAIGVPIAVHLMLAYGWRAMFALIGLVSLVWMIPWLYLVRRDDPVASDVLQKASRHGANTVVAWKALFLSPAIWGIFVGTFCYAYFMYFCVTWLPTYFLKRYGMSLQEMGWYTSLSFTGMAAVAVLAGWAADTIIRGRSHPISVRKVFTVTGLGFASIQILGIWTESASLSLLFAVVSLSGLGLATANYWALTQSLIPGSAIGKVAGIQNMASNSAGIVSPWFTGWLVLKTGTFEAPMQLIGILLVVGMGCYVALVRPHFAPKLGDQPVALLKTSCPVSR